MLPDFVTSHWDDLRTALEGIGLEPMNIEHITREVEKLLFEGENEKKLLTD